MCKHLVQQAKEKGAILACLPECFAFMGNNANESFANSQSLEGPLFAQYKQIALDFSIWISFGGFAERCQSEGKIRNTHIIVGPDGKVKQSYAKLHLFDVKLKDRDFKESNGTIAGDRIVAYKSPIGCLGMSICYDLRFPGMFQALRDQGTEIILVPSAFTVETGRAHWMSLLRARAIETQCFVVAAAQCGRHNDNRESYGHSCIIDPWGEVMVELGKEEGFAVAELDMSYLKDIRDRMPVLQHRRGRFVFE